jgi:hypothetical protein
MRDRSYANVFLLDGYSGDMVILGNENQYWYLASPGVPAIKWHHSRNPYEKYEICWERASTYRNARCTLEKSEEYTAVGIQRVYDDK